MLTSVPLLDEILEPYASAVGKDFAAYRNHTYRVINFCVALSPSDDPVSLQKMAIAAAFHDLGIWTDKTFDYLPPSERLAHSYLTKEGRAEWGLEIGAMIHEHHKVSRYRSDAGGSVETFRRADWVDVSRGVVNFGLPRALLRQVFAAFPNAGFHKRLVQLSLGRLLRHPLNPLPMFRL